MQNKATIKPKNTTQKKSLAFQVHMLEQESIRTLYRNRLKGNFTLLSGERGANWLKIKEAITKAAEERASGISGGRTGNGFERGMTK